MYLNNSFVTFNNTNNTNKTHILNNTNKTDILYNTNEYIVLIALSPLVICCTGVILIILKECSYLIIQYIKEKIKKAHKYLYEDKNIANNKLTKKYIKKLNKDNKESVIDSTCSICLESVEKNGISLNCKHYFHNECLQKWVKEQLKNIIVPTCPTCRTIVIDIPDRKKECVNNNHYNDYNNFSDYSDFSDYD